MLNTNELYKKRLYYLHVEVTKRQFLAQVTDPQAFVNASYHPVEQEAYDVLLGKLEREEVFVEDDVLEWAKVEQPAVDRLLRARTH
jgi:hypothetical protein